MNVGILGLGLIGGSLARAFKKAGHVVFAADVSARLFYLLEQGGVFFVIYHFFSLRIINF